MFETYIYQPLFNILVGLYEILGRISPELADMGIAVIIFSIIIQILLFPLRLAGERSEEEKKKIVRNLKEYCGLDTKAMYAIYKHLYEIVAAGNPTSQRS